MEEGWQVNEGCSPVRGATKPRAYWRTKADDCQACEVLRCMLRKHVGVLIPDKEGCMVQQQQCSALIHCTVCRALNTLFYGNH